MMIKIVIVIASAITVPIGMWMIIHTVVQLGQDDEFKDWLTGNNKK